MDRTRTAAAKAATLNKRTARALKYAQPTTLTRAGRARKEA